MRNPQAAQQYEQLRKNNGDPRVFLQQVTGNFTPEQTQRFMQFANGFGFSNEQLQQFGINSK